MRRLAAVIALVQVPLVLVASAAALAGQGTSSQPLTLERIFEDPPIEGVLPANLQWLPGNREFSFVERQGAGKDASATLWVEDAASGRRSKIVAESDLTPVGEGASAIRVRLGGYQWSPKADALLLSGGGDLFLFDRASHAVRRLTATSEDEELATFSPDGSRVAFVRANDLYVVDLRSGRETRITTTGSVDRFNGRFDWVYEEELAGRVSRAYEWSPASNALFYLSLDDSEVPRFPHVGLLATHPTVEEQRYPKAGDPNPVPSLELAELAAGPDGALEVRRQPVTWEGRTAEYVARLGWLPDGKAVWFQLLDRPQQRLEVVRCDLPARVLSTLLVETDAAWVNLHDDLRFLADGTFVWSSERSGFRHLELHDKAGQRLRALTSGNWEVVGVEAVDEASGTVLFSATEASVLGENLYRVSLGGGALTRLTHGAGVHRVNVAPDGRFFVDSHSEVMKPPTMRVADAEGRTLRELEPFVAPELGRYRTAVPEFVTVTSSTGTRLYGEVLRPFDIQPGMRYPVVVYVYGGPHSQTVQNRWGGRYALISQLLAARGFVVFSIDGRGTAARGREFERALLGRFGKVELEDQLAGVEWLKRQKFVDPARIGIWGASYGGFMTIYALLNAPDVFRAGFAVASVTDWRLYDSIYTERYLKLPADNPEGYRDSSPVNQADRLKGKLLLVHGTADDNVHWHNTLIMADTLVRAGKSYELQLYAGATHRRYRPDQRLDEVKRMVEFFERTLR